MAVKSKPQVFQTSDGEEWETEAEANVRQALLDAKSAFDQAERAYGQKLAETQKTADGLPFEWGVWSDYWWPTHWADGRPSLARLSVIGRETLIQDGVVHIVPYAEHGQARISVKVNELFRRESAAKIDLLRRMEEYVGYVKQDIETLRNQIKEQR